MRSEKYPFSVCLWNCRKQRKEQENNTLKQKIDKKQNKGTPGILSNNTNKEKNKKIIHSNKK